MIPRSEHARDGAGDAQVPRELYQVVRGELEDAKEELQRVRDER